VTRCFARLAGACSLAPLLLLAPSCGGGGGSHTCSPAASFPAGIDHGPLVSRPSPTSEAIAFWSTSSVVGGVEYGTTPSYGATVSDASPATRHVLTLSPLAPSTTYHYRVLLAGAPAGVDHAFTTPPDQGATPVRFVVSGDGGTGCPQAFTMVSVAASQAPDFVLHTGDAAYDGGTASQVRTGFSIPWADVAATTPIFTTIGNHDFDSGGGQPLLDAQALPESSPGESRWYSFDWGPCHLICLDSNVDTAPASPQGTWLAADLAAHAAPWTFAFFHHPVYSSSRHGSTAALDTNLVPVFDAAHLDVAFSGHDHDYERTFPMFAGSPVDVAMDPDYVDPQGTVYVVSGGGGKGLYTSGTSAFTAFSVSAFNVTRVEIDGGTLSITALAQDGSTLDHATISKTP